MKTAIVIFSVIALSCNVSKKKSAIEFPNEGYLLPEKPDTKDSSFPFYPIRHMETVSDSTHDAFYMKKLLEVFNEENISLKAQKKPLFRIIIHPWTSPTYFIRISEGEIFLKKGNRVDYLHLDKEKLSLVEQEHFDIFDRGVPLSRRIKESTPGPKKYLDSVVKLYPQLLTDEYYKYLMNKAFVPLTTPFTYTTKIVQLNNSDFSDIVDSLYSSGYWQLPVEVKCNDMPTDGDLYILEYNNGSKYYIVKFWSCGDEPTKFKRTFEKILQYAGLSQRDYFLNPH